MMSLDGIGFKIKRGCCRWSGSREEGWKGSKIGYKMYWGLQIVFWMRNETCFSKCRLFCLGCLLNLFDFESIAGLRKKR